MINFETTAEDSKIIQKIVERMERAFTETKPGKRFDRMSAHMDITACHANGCPLKLQELLTAPDFDFNHDVFGISRQIDRKTGKLTDCFLPRFAAPDQKPDADAEQEKADRAALRYVGLMGHGYASVRTAADGTVSSAAEFNSVSDIEKICRKGDRVYVRVKKSWHRVVTPALEVDAPEPALTA